ncbi:MAG: c-type cytochrome [Ktedonobacterales bacterium]|nr:c-type cytochrome [Ktedonobacterales bacterium]
MENSRNPGFFAVAVGVALSVLFALLGITTVLPGRVGFGLAGVCLLVSALIYITYTRGNPVSKTGFGTLLFIMALGLIMPILFVNQQQVQADQTSAQYDLTLRRGAAIFAQYCATCHGFQGQGIDGPKLNNNADVNTLSDDDLTRIISGGIPGDPTNPGKLAMPAWLNTFGGSLTEEDIGYLVSFIRSSDPSYLATKGLPNVNGFSYVLGSLSNPTQIAQYHEQEKGGSKPPANQFTDDTGKKQVNLQIMNMVGGAQPWGFSPQNVIISMGTTVTWTNVSNAPHTVVTRPGTTPPQTFQSDSLNQGSGTFSFTFTKAGDYPYYCSIHPGMLAWAEVK